MKPDATPVAEGSYEWYRREVEHLRAERDEAVVKAEAQFTTRLEEVAERDALKAELAEARAAIHEVFDCWADPFGNWTAEQADAARAQKSQMLRRLLVALDAPQRPEDTRERANAAPYRDGRPTDADDYGQDYEAQAHALGLPEDTREETGRG